MYKQSKTDIFFSRFEETRGEKTRYLPPKSLAIGKFKRTWPWQEIAKNDIRKTISNLPQCIIFLFKKTRLCLYQTILTTKSTHFTFYMVRNIYEANLPVVIFCGQKQNLWGKFVDMKSMRKFYWLKI